MEFEGLDLLETIHAKNAFPNQGFAKAERIQEQMKEYLYKRETFQVKDTGAL